MALIPATIVYKFYLGSTWKRALFYGLKVFTLVTLALILLPSKGMWNGLLFLALGSFIIAYLDKEAKEKALWIALMTTGMSLLLRGIFTALFFVSIT